MGKGRQRVRKGYWFLTLENTGQHNKTALSRSVVNLKPHSSAGDVSVLSTPPTRSHLVHARPVLGVQRQVLDDAAAQVQQLLLGFPRRHHKGTRSLPLPLPRPPL